MKTRFLKKALSAVLATALVATLTTSAFAAKTPTISDYTLDWPTEWIEAKAMPAWTNGVTGDSEIAQSTMAAIIAEYYNQADNFDYDLGEQNHGYGLLGWNDMVGQQFDGGDNIGNPWGQNVRLGIIAAPYPGIAFTVKGLFAANFNGLGTPLCNEFEYEGVTYQVYSIDTASITADHSGIDKKGAVTVGTGTGISAATKDALQEAFARSSYDGKVPGAPTGMAEVQENGDTVQDFQMLTITIPAGGTAADAIFTSADNSLTDFAIEDGETIVDGSAINVTVPFGTDVTALIPTFTIAETSTVSPALGVVQDFTDPVIYTVTAENGKSVEYTVTVTVAPDTSDDNTLTNFVIPGGTTTVDGNAISVVMPAGTVVTALVPTFTIAATSRVSPASGVAQNFTSPVKYTVTSGNGDPAEYTVTVTVALSADNSLTNFVIPGGTTTVNGNAISVVMPAGTDVTALTPTFTIAATAAVSPLSGVVQDFTSPVTYTVTAENKQTAVYTVTVTVAAATAITSNEYAVDETNKIIKKVSSKSTVAEFKAKVSPDVIVYAADGTTVAADTAKMNGKMKVKTTSGTVKYDIWVIGDVNDDGELDSADISQVINAITGKSTDAALKERANVNGDTELDIADISALVNILVGK